MTVRKFSELEESCSTTAPSICGSKFCKEMIHSVTQCYTDVNTPTACNVLVKLNELQPNELQPWFACAFFVVSCTCYSLYTHATIDFYY